MMNFRFDDLYYPTPADDSARDRWEAEFISHTTEMVRISPPSDVPGLYPPEYMQAGD